jgi:O-antigen/teichoic acid export membrane protein
MNSSWVLLGYFMRLLIIIFVYAKIAELIGAEDNGWYNLAISCFTILYALSTLGFDSTFVIKKLVEESDSPDNQKRLLGTFFFGRIVFSLCLLTGLALYIWFFANDIRYWVLLIASFAALFQGYDIFYSYYQWKFRANVYVSAELISLLISSLGFIYGLFMGYGIFYFITIYAAERLFFLCGLLFHFHKNVFPIHSLSFSLKELRINFMLSWPLMVGALLTALYQKFDQFLIGPILSMEDLGIYGPSVTLSQIWLVVPSLIVPVVFPKIAMLRKEKNRKRYKEMIYTVYGLLNYLAIGVIIFILLFGDLIVTQLYGIQYLKSIPLLYVLIFETLILFQSNLTSYILILEDEEKYLFVIKLVGVVMNIILNIIFLKIYGLSFAPWSLLISAASCWLVMGLFNKKMGNLVRLNFASFLLVFNLKKVLS